MVGNVPLVNNFRSESPKAGCGSRKPGCPDPGISVGARICTPSGMLDDSPVPSQPAPTQPWLFPPSITLNFQRRSGAMSVR